MKIDKNDCFFYHSFDDIKGDWDLRENINLYTGLHNFRDKTVLEIGPASGFVTGYMEQNGANVTSIDLNPYKPFDFVPFYDMPVDDLAAKEMWRKLNNSFLYYKELRNLKANLIFQDVYEINKSIGLFDTSIFGCVLLHLRSPFTALQKVAAVTKNTIIVAEPMWKLSMTQRFGFWMLEKISKATGFSMRPSFFLPEHSKHWPNNFTWWYNPPQTTREMLSILGFTESKIYYHNQKFNKNGCDAPHYTIIAHRKIKMK